MNNKEMLNVYKRGMITEEEYEKFKEGNLNRELTLKEQLELKLIKEYDKFTKELLSRSKEEILSSSYEITSKEEIRDMLSWSDLDELEIKALLEEDDILNEFYRDWLDDDSALGDSMEYCIKDSIDIVMRCYNKRKNKNEKENDER